MHVDLAIEYDTKLPFWEFTIHIIMKKGKTLINHRLITAAIAIIMHSASQSNRHVRNWHYTVVVVTDVQ